MRVLVTPSDDFLKEVLASGLELALEAYPGMPILDESVPCSIALGQNNNSIGALVTYFPIDPETPPKDISFYSFEEKIDAKANIIFSQDGIARGEDIYLSTLSPGVLVRELDTQKKCPFYREFCLLEFEKPYQIILGHEMIKLHVWHTKE